MINELLFIILQVKQAVSIFVTQVPNRRISIHVLFENCIYLYKNNALNTSFIYESPRLFALHFVEHSSHCLPIVKVDAKKHLIAGCGALSWLGWHVPVKSNMNIYITERNG